MIPDYTADWFTADIPVWTELLAGLKPNAEILEIGAFEGRATCWLLDHFPSATVTTIDPFDHILGQPDSAVATIRQRFLANTAPYGPRCWFLNAPSRVVLPRLLTQHRTFDFIYVDGSHWASDVIFDGVCGFQLLRVGGLMCFDDYTWSHPSVPEVQSPRQAIKAFLSSHIGRAQLTRPPEAQAWVRKLR